METAMCKTRVIALVITLFAMTTLGNAFAKALDDAFDAYSRGDYKTAYELFRPLAEQGDPISQFAQRLL